ncbi:SDR family oxidoreductase [Bacillus sp. DJP31]|uniref:SDR family oxidoreductase n=1 Tax=Bacillus sp. DJP31 TaxID=3409789 RepID=UPI003BB640CB
MSKILVTGSTGNIGRYVVDELVKRGQQVKGATYSINQHNNSNVEVVPFDFLNPATFDHALKDVDKVFLVRPPKLAKPKKDMKPFLDALLKKKIKQVVFISLMGVEKNPIAPHKKIEDMMISSGLPYTFLRPSFFMQNLNTTHQDDIRLRDELYLPVGNAKTSFIDTRDIAEVAAVCLTEQGHIGKAYTLTGAKALDYHQVATILSKVLGREIVYKNPGIIKFRNTSIKRGIKKEYANVMTMLYFLTKMGAATTITSNLKVLLNKMPISFEQYAEDHKAFWLE